MIGFRLTGARCRCGGCAEVFNSVSAFDKHRVGPYRQFRDPLAGPDRRCLTIIEMSAVGMSRNAKGFWRTESRAERQKRAASRGRAPNGGDWVQP